MGIDDGAQHPAGPAFDKAHNEREAWGDQQVTPLTPEQLPRYNAIIEQHDQKHNAKIAELRANEREFMIERMRHHLSARELTPRPGPEKRSFADEPNRLHDAVPDYVDRKVTNLTTSHENKLGAAYNAAMLDRARYEVDQFRQLQMDLRTDLDRLVKTFEQERQMGGKEQEFRQETKAVTEPGKAMQFNTAANNQSWREAVLKAARREAERSRDHELTKDFNKAR